MRNLVEYPITTGEVYSALQEAQTIIRAPGGTEGISLLLAEQFIKQNEALFREFVGNHKFTHYTE